MNRRRVLTGLVFGSALVSLACGDDRPSFTPVTDTSKIKDASSAELPKIPKETLKKLKRPTSPKVAPGGMQAN